MSRDEVKLAMIEAANAHVLEREFPFDGRYGTGKRVCRCGAVVDADSDHRTSAVLDAALAAGDEDGVPLLLGLLADPDEPHIIQFGVVGWTVKHPLAERIHGDLFDCEWNTACHALDGPPGEPGDYDARMIDGVPVFILRGADDA